MIKVHRQIRKKIRKTKNNKRIRKGLKGKRDCILEANNRKDVQIQDGREKRDYVRSELDDQYTITKKCPKCGTNMVYAFGEVYECPNCGDKEYTDFGKIREYLEEHGPQNAVTIADATGVSVKVIQKFLYQGRIEIPDGSDSYIKCQMCGADIRYGRLCPECTAKLNKDKQAMVYVGEKPKHKRDVDGKMHTLDERERENVSRKPIAMRRNNNKK